MKKKFKNLLLFLLMFLIPLYFFIYEIYSIYLSEINTTNAINNFKNNLTINSENTINKEDNKNKINNVIGLLIFPEKDNFQLPIFEGFDMYSLQVGIGRDTTSCPIRSNGLTILAGHRNDHLLGIIQKLRKDEKIKIKLLNGEEVMFKIIDDPFNTKYTKKKYSGIVVDEKDKIILRDDEKKPYLLIYTCYPFIFGASTKERFLVFAEASN